jgi:thioredoxin 1
MLEIKDEKSLNQVMSNEYVILYFTAKWCGPCRNISPVFMQLSTQYKNIFFCKIDVDITENKPIVDKYHVEGLPTFIFYKNGLEVDKFTGSNIELLKNRVAIF